MPSKMRVQAMIDEAVSNIEGAAAALDAITGRSFYVNNAAADNADATGYGSFATPYATIAYAVSAAGVGDTIVVMPAHSETISTMLSLTVHMTILGLGKPEIACDAVIDCIRLGEGCRVIGLNFLTATAALTAWVDINGKDATIEDCDFTCGSNTLTAVTCTATSDGSVIRGCRFNVAENGPDSAIKIEDALADRIRIEDCTFHGMSTTNAWDDGAIHSTVAHTSCVVKDCLFHFGPAVIFTAAATGLLEGLRAYGVGTDPTAVIDPGSCQTVDCRVGAAVDSQLTEFPHRIPGLGLKVTKSITAANGEVTIANVAGGEILVRAIYGKVTTLIGSTSSNLKLVANPTATGSTLDLCTAVAVATDAVGVLYSCDGTVGNALDVDKIGAVATLARPFVVATGAIACNFSADPVGGVIEWTIIYEPITPAATCIAA